MVSKMSVTGHAQLAGAGAVDVGIELRHVHLPAREQAGELGRLRGLGHEGLHGRVHAFVADRAAVLQLQLEAARGAQPLHRRRREHHDEGVLDAGVGLVQLGGHRGPALVGALALVEGLEHGEHDPRVGAVGEAVDRQSREGQGALHVGVLLRDLAHAANHCFCAVQRGAVGQLREADQVLLVLRRHEAGRHDVEQAGGGEAQHGIDRQRGALVREHRLDAAAVGLAAAQEEPC
jgi:hypothetical protein